MTSTTSTTSTGRRAAIALAALGLTTVALAGCSHGSSAGKGDASSGGSAVKPASQVVTPKADAIVNDPKARPSVSMKDCAATGSGWSAGGSVTNSKDKAATFTIVVSFTTKQSTVLARGETKVTVKAGATKSWSTQANFAKSKGTQCVLRGVSED